MNREDFEKLKLIKKRIKRSDVYFQDELDEYHTNLTDKNAVYDEMYVNGAWMMFQELKNEQI